MKKLVCLLALMSCGSAEAAKSPQSPNYDCIRHVYNLSGGWFTVGYSAQSGSASLSCTAASRQTAKAKKLPANACSIPPHSTATVGFNLDFNDQVYGYVTMADPFGHVASYYFLGYGGMGGSGCPYIQHSGSTAGVNLNEPTNGDLQLYGPLGKRSAAQIAEDRRVFREALARAKKKAAKPAS